MAGAPPRIVGPGSRSPFRAAPGDEVGDANERESQEPFDEYANSIYADEGDL